MKIKKVILVTIDSLRADSSELIVNTMQKLFGKVFSSTIFSNGPGTPQAFPSILSSSSFLLLDRNFHVTHHMILLSEIMSKYNFITIGIHSNPYLAKTLGWGRGFKIFLDYSKSVSSPLSRILQLKLLRSTLSLILHNEHIRDTILLKLEKIYQTLLSLGNLKPPYIGASKITFDAMKHLLTYKDKNLFLWIHYMDTHWPYNVPEEQLTRECKFNSARQALNFLYRQPISFISSSVTPKISKESLDKMKCLYRKSIVYVNKHLKRLFTFLEELGILNESLIIVTGDHGEAFLEHNILGHPFFALYNENLQVPLIIWCHDMDKYYTNIVTLKQHRELAPWIVKTLNMKVPKIWLSEKPLVKSNIFAESAYVNPFSMSIYKDKYIVSIISDNYKLIWDRVKNKMELYNIEADPKEERNIADKSPDVVKQLQSLISKYITLLKITRALQKFN